ncbi:MULTISPECIES: outer membrane beta-barrel protein [Methylobacterium]|jgi:opacity protein-like surface antigen|uniref:outer membrane protein n=1 Tax=Methylobacterium TaxID=407 RepID=UPI0008E1B2BA|nr:MULTISPECIES: outer membrane beta-barrel protein [Methylobacterium]MBZ6411995.1 TonB-dependent receptor [Methylobacterium sp.]MBK3394977.1 porin family protein [Methylobacterium ajmalii]MBK3409766.1 porin family protein [Methylobacterium ajmalii]MBK3424939.1 porin family protein [Methylobacterium ajmalii]SFF23840.1 Opacity protein [Methylobacterium sp. yr596]
MGRSKPLALARIFTLAASVAAPGLVHAADLLPPPPMPLPPPPVEIGGSWYLRGDVGVGILDLRKTVVEDVSTPRVPYKYTAIEDHVGDQAFVGVGVGYQYNPWLRFDVTGEYRTQAEWRFLAEDRSYDTRGGYNLTTGKFSSVVGLANGYVDLGNWYGITPFVGAGVGFAHHMFGSVTDQGQGTYAGGLGYGRAKDKTNFAWAAHAGLSYAVTPNLKLELAYRYLNMGEAETGVVGCLPSCALKTVYRAKELESHDIKLGMRWMFGAPVVTAAYEPPPPPMPMAPLVRKY